MYLVINKLGPKTSCGSFRWVMREQGVVLPDLINVLKDDQGLGIWLAIMNENRDFLMHRVVLEEEGTLVK